MATSVPQISNMHFVYSLFFLWIEPCSTIIGAFYAHFQPLTYLNLTHAPSYPTAILLTSLQPDIATTTVLSQLANLYVLFALNEGLVLRSTNNLRVWKTLLFGLLVADLGHLYSVKNCGTIWEVYINAMKWNKMMWGNVGFVYAGAVMRTCFLCGVGVDPSSMDFGKNDKQS